MKKMLLTLRMNRVVSMLLVLCMVLLSMAACTNGQHSEGTFDAADDINSKTPNNIDDIIYYDEDYDELDKMREETLLYPSQNDEWRYNVYNTYIELTEYIGKPVTELIVPEEIDDLPVKAYSVKFTPNTIISVKLPSALVIIGDNAFASDRKTSLTNINLPEGLIEIGDNAFKYCEQLTDIELPSTLKKIGASAFRDCDNIKSLTIPASIEEIGAGAFWINGYHTLEDVTILNPNISLDLSNLSCDMIYGYIGSTAAAYAAKHEISFKVIEE